MNAKPFSIGFKDDGTLLVTIEGDNAQRLLHLTQAYAKAKRNPSLAERVHDAPSQSLMGLLRDLMDPPPSPSEPLLAPTPPPTPKLPPPLDPNREHLWDLMRRKDVRTQSALADLSGISIGTIGTILNHGTIVTLPTAESIASALGLKRWQELFMFEPLYTSFLFAYRPYRQMKEPYIHLRKSRLHWPMIYRYIMDRSRPMLPFTDPSDSDPSRPSLTPRERAQQEGAS